MKLSLFLCLTVLMLTICSASPIPLNIKSNIRKFNCRKPCFIGEVSFNCVCEFPVAVPRQLTQSYQIGYGGGGGGGGGKVGKGSFYGGGQGSGFAYASSGGSVQVSGGGGGGGGGSSKPRPRKYGF